MPPPTAWTLTSRQPSPLLLAASWCSPCPGPTPGVSEEGPPWPRPVLAAPQGVPGRAPGIEGHLENAGVTQGGRVKLVWGQDQRSSLRPEVTVNDNTHQLQEGGVCKTSRI